MRTLKKGAKGEDVKTIQIYLQQRGHNIGARGVDGVFGADTYKAVVAFQTNMGLWADGTVGAETFYALVNNKLKTGSRLANGSYLSSAPNTPVQGQSPAKALPPIQTQGTDERGLAPSTESDSTLWWWVLGGGGLWWYLKSKKKNRTRPQD